MDFSLLQPNARVPLLRDILALKTRWVYYVIMVVDCLLRFSWIFYAIFTHNRQHSTLVSFLVALAEAFRRGIWTLLRVENEHCSNVAVYKAYRDLPLPYRLPSVLDRPSEDEEEEEEEETPTEVEGVTLSGAGERRRRPGEEAEATGVQYGMPDEEAAVDAGGVERSEPMAAALRRRKTSEQVKPVQSFSRILADAHLQDFEKRRKPADQVGEEFDARGQRNTPSDDEDDLDEDEMDVDADEENGDNDDDGIRGGPWRTNSFGGRTDGQGNHPRG